MNEYVNKCVNTHHMMTFACEGNIIIHRVYSMRRITYVHSGGMLKKKCLSQYLIEFLESKSWRGRVNGKRDMIRKCCYL